jgi:hypothetical protein
VSNKLVIVEKTGWQQLVTAANPVTAQARWAARDWMRRTGMVPAPPDARTGSTVMVWVNAAGRLGRGMASDQASVAAFSAVRAENLVRGSSQQGCLPCRPTVKITGHVPTVHLPPDHAELRLARREERWKTAEILILRHQIAVPQRRQPRYPKLDRADQAFLATLLAVIPKAHFHGLQLPVTPDTVLPWHRHIVRRRAPKSMRGTAGRPATRRNIRALVLRLVRENPGWDLPQDPWVNWPGLGGWS